MNQPGLNSGTTHGNLPLERYLRDNQTYVQNLQTGYIKGDKWYVDGELAGSGDGTTWEKAFTTIEEAIDAASDDDVIFVAPHQYKEDVTVNITQENLKLLAANTGVNHALIRTEIRQHGNVDVPCITVNAHGVEIAGFRITPYSDDEGIGILLASTQAVYGTYIHDNYFYSVEIGYMASAIHLGIEAETYATDSTCIFNNFFYAGGTGTGGASGTAKGIIQMWKSCHDDIRGNFFEQYTNHATNYAININDTGNGIRVTIVDNQFWAAELTVADCVCVAINNPVAVGGDAYIDGNHFVNYAGDDQCLASSLNTCTGLNYINEAVVTGE